MPSVSGAPVQMNTAATVGIVRPMLASAEPSARFMLVCSRFARAAPTAASPSGSSTSAAIAMPTAASGAPSRSTVRSTAGDSSFASSTTATRLTNRNAMLVSAVRPLGGTAWTDSSALPSIRK